MQGRQMTPDEKFIDYEQYKQSQLILVKAKNPFSYYLSVVQSQVPEVNIMIQPEYIDLEINAPQPDL